MLTDEQMKPMIRLEDSLTRMEEAAWKMNDSSSDSVNLS